LYGAREGRSIGASRVLLATCFGLVAACWPFAPFAPFSNDEWKFATETSVGRVDLLSPRGRLDRPPHHVRWSTTHHAARFRVRVLDPRGRLLFERDTDEGRARGVQLTGCERRAWEEAGRCRVEVDLAAADGELVAASDPVESWLGPP
jgi:hypothetical protein